MSSAAAKQFIDHLRGVKKRSDARATPDPAAARTEWLRELDALFARIDGWLRDAEQESLVTVHRESTTVQHDGDLGSYDAPTRIVVMPGDVGVHIFPAGRRVLGHDGRVDAVAAGRSFRLLRATDGSWSLATPTFSKSLWDLAPLDEAAFLQALRDLVG